VAGDSASPRVLVIDDTEAIRTIIRRVLTGAGYRVDVAASAPEARSMDPAGYDALLVDAHLGRERGTALIQALMAEDPAVAGRCLLITGGKPDVVPVGVVCLTKPFRPDELIAAVGALRPADSAAPAEVPEKGRPRSGPPPPGAPPPGPPGPPAWQLLSLIERLRTGERAAIADFIHDGPIQDLTAAVLSVQALTRLPPGDVVPRVAELGRHLDAAAGSVRQIVDDALPVQVEAGLGALVRQRAAWLPFSPVTAEFQRTSAAPGPAASGAEVPGPAASGAEAPVIAEIIELVLFALAGLAPPGRADVLVQAGEKVLEIVLTLTPMGATSGAAGNAVAAQASLAELAQALGGTARASFGASPWRARIQMPSRPAACGLGTGCGTARSAGQERGARSRSTPSRPAM
jgi:CheY-like chemotaxis protein